MEHLKYSQRVRYKMARENGEANIGNQLTDIKDQASENSVVNVVLCDKCKDETVISGSSSNAVSTSVEESRCFVCKTKTARDKVYGNADCLKGIAVTAAGTAVDLAQSVVERGKEIPGQINEVIGEVSQRAQTYAKDAVEKNAERLDKMIDELKSTCEEGFEQLIRAVEPNDESNSTTSVNSTQDTE